MPKRSSKKREDINETAGRVLRIAVGDEPKPDPDSGKNPAAVALGRLGGIKGGKARAAKLSSAERKAIAKKAASARWKRDDSAPPS